MARTSKLLTEEVVKLAEETIAKLGKTGAVAIKLRAIISAHKLGITTVAEAFGTTKATLISWIKTARGGEEALKLLSVQEGRGRKYPVTESQQESIKSWMQEDPQVTINKVKQKISHEFGLDISRSTVHRIMKNLDFSYITARPKHYKQDTASLPELKKKSNKTD